MLTKHPFSNPTMRNDGLAIASTFASLIETPAPTEILDSTEENMTMPTPLDIVQILRKLQMDLSMLFELTVAALCMARDVDMHKPVAINPFTY